MKGLTLTSGGEDALLTILTSDTMSMLAMSMFIPTPTGGPGTGESNIEHREVSMID